MAQAPAEGQQVRSDSGKLLGYIQDLPDGKQGVRDRFGNLRGIFDPKKNETRDWRGRRVGAGNLLETLVGARQVPQVRVLAVLKRRLLRLRRT